MKFIIFTRKIHEIHGFGLGKFMKFMIFARKKHEIHGFHPEINPEKS